MTIATFDQAAQARLAENVLKEAGLAVMVSDENLVAMDCLLSNAIGGVKVQVWEEDADKAVSILEERFGEHGEGLDADVTPEELATEAEKYEPEEGDELAAPESDEESNEPKEDHGPATESRENLARRLVFTAWLGLVFPLVAPYALYIFRKAAFSEGALSPRGKFNLYLGGALMLASLFWLMVFWRALPR